MTTTDLNGVDSVTTRVSLQDLRPVERKLLRAAQKMALSENAYNPLTGFYVGSAALTLDGALICGSNVENDALGSSICSERVALMVAHATGLGDSMCAIAIVARGPDGPTEEPAASCGECRQVIHGFAIRSGVGDDFKIILATSDLSIIEVSTIGKLLPRAFVLKALLRPPVSAA